MAGQQDILQALLADASRLSGRPVTGFQPPTGPDPMERSVMQLLQLALGIAPGSGEVMSAQQSMQGADEAYRQFGQGNIGQGIADMANSFVDAAGALPLLGVLPRGLRQLIDLRSTDVMQGDITSSVAPMGYAKEGVKFSDEDAEAMLKVLSENYDPETLAASEISSYPAMFLNTILDTPIMMSTKGGSPKDLTEAMQARRKELGMKPMGHIEPSRAAAPVPEQVADMVSEAVAAGERRVAYQDLRGIELTDSQRSKIVQDLMGRAGKKGDVPDDNVLAADWFNRRFIPDMQEETINILAETIASMKGGDLTKSSREQAIQMYNKYLMGSERGRLDAPEVAEAFAQAAELVKERYNFPVVRPPK